MQFLKTTSWWYDLEARDILKIGWRHGVSKALSICLTIYPSDSFRLQKWNKSFAFILKKKNKIKLTVFSFIQRLICICFYTLFCTSLLCKEQCDCLFIFLNYLHSRWLVKFALCEFHLSNLCIKVVSEYRKQWGQTLLIGLLPTRCYGIKNIFSIFLQL